MKDEVNGKIPSINLLREVFPDMELHISPAPPMQVQHSHAIARTHDIPLHFQQLHIISVPLTRRHPRPLQPFPVVLRLFFDFRPPSFTPRTRRSRRRRGVPARPTDRVEEGEVKVREQRAQGGEAGTDNGHSRFNLRPHIASGDSVCTDYQRASNPVSFSNSQVISPPLTKSIVTMRIKLATQTLPSVSDCALAARST